AEHGLDLTRIAGTGLGGRVTKKEVEAYLASGGKGGTQSPAKAAEEVPPWEQVISGDLFKPTDEIFAKASGKTAAQVPAPRQSAPMPAPHGQPGELMPH